MDSLTFAIAASGTEGISNQPVPDGHRLSSLELPTLDSTTLTLSLSTDGATYNAIYDVAGNAIGVVGGAASTGAKIIEIPDYIGRLTEGRLVKITVAAQSGGARTIKGIASRLDGGGSSSSAGAGSGTAPVGGASLGANHVTAGAAATLVAARPGRTGVLVKNQDTSLTVFIGPATVSASNGLELKPGESVYLPTSALVQCFAAVGSPVVDYVELY